ncbi:unnamed protein product [Darwinula stevensoni]|uniref:Growth hormone-regulated TBC protein 1 n=1 Tax=Darwinula stevensoni TaxID=69355 RepID=A0A7R8XHL1_9CRUS|nr:unnamed protein product [Darwinula stevensoni]CAG0892888.1 unnamed protein product [Darwinula stevensoni]
MAAPKIVQIRSGATKQVDGYGFLKEPDFDDKEHADYVKRYLPILVNRRKKWDALLQKQQLPLSKNDLTKRYIRKGIPQVYRRLVWMDVSGAQRLKESHRGRYKALLASSLSKEVVHAIKVDLSRTFTHNVYFGSSPDGLRLPLFNVLGAFASAHPDVGYCQGLNYVAGLLLLVTRCEEDTFWLLEALRENILPSRYYAADLFGVLVDMEVLGYLIGNKVPRVHAHFKKQGIAWNLLVTRWHVCLYADVLPVETVLRIWDCLFYEGSKVLFRVGIALVKLGEEKILGSNDLFAITESMKETCTGPAVLDCHAFIRRSLEIADPLSGKTIASLRGRVGEDVEKFRGLRGRRCGGFTDLYLGNPLDPRS